MFRECLEILESEDTSGESSVRLFSLGVSLTRDKVAGLFPGGLFPQICFLRSITGEAVIVDQSPEDYFREIGIWNLDTGLQHPGLQLTGYDNL
jgi:hypothetical protein